MRSVLVLMIFLLGVVRAALANDSQAEIAVGGLTLLQSDAISLDSEDLFISENEVRVDYRFTNTSNKDVETLVAFPLPDQLYDEGSGEGPIYRLAHDLDFKTTVDGKPVSYTVVEQAIFKGKDVTARLKEAGLGVMPPEDNDKADAHFKAKHKSVLEALVKDGLVQVDRNGNAAFYAFKWDLRTSVTRKQTFPAGKTISVRHRYKPVAGGSVGGNLSKEFRKEKWAKTHSAQYCIEDSWFKSFDAQVAKRATKDNPAPYSETWLGYVLKSGANWKGPIKDFRLVVDKGSAENLVSFCAQGVKKIGPTRFEMKKKNFEPKEDLNVLIVKWAKPE